MKLTLIAFSLFFSLNCLAQEWIYDMEEAKILASQQQKNILLVFSGSDWCAPCIKLDRQIWQSESFITHAEKNLVLVRADFPKRKNNQLPKELQDQNKTLAERYNNNGYFPFVLLLNSKGEVLNKLGYKNISPEDYITAIYEK
jgi:thioredoxin-related protein